MPEAPRFETKELHGQTFAVLKVRRLAGQDSLSLRHPDLGTFALLRDWTDWAPPGTEPPSGSAPILFDAFALLRLAELVATLNLAKGVDE